jgi:enoyl-CoA hydratase
VYSGRFLPAPEAAALGIVERVVAADALLETAIGYARQLARGPREALAAAKASIRAAVETPGSAGIRAEREAFLALFGTADQREGMAAFLEKRDPRFGG